MQLCKKRLLIIFTFSELLQTNLEICKIFNVQRDNIPFSEKPIDNIFTAILHSVHIERFLNH